MTKTVEIKGVVITGLAVRRVADKYNVQVAYYREGTDGKNYGGGAIDITKDTENTKELKALMNKVKAIVEQKEEI